MENNTDIYYKLGEMHGDIKSTLAEAKRTNGRVTKLEQETIPKLEKGINTEINQIKLKIAYYTGGFAVVIWLLEKAINQFG